MPLRRGSCFFIASVSLALPALSAAQATHTTFSLGASSTTSRATGVSSDGTVAAGYANVPTFNSFHGMRWRSGVGTQDLGLVSGQNAFDFTKALDVSGDGTTIVGERYGTSGGGYPSVATRWTAANGYELLGTMTGGNRTVATGSNENGSILTGIGNSSLGTNRSFRWVSGSGFQDLGTMSGGTSAYAARINLDGSVIVGSGDSSAGANRAFRWTSAGMQDLGVLSGMTESFATDVNGDGSVVVGYSGTSTADRRAVRWVNGVIEDLGLFPGSVRTSAFGISPDGNTIVGSYSASTTQAGERAFVWRQGSGYQDLTTFAIQQGLNFPSTGPWLMVAQDVSNGGRTFVGYQGSNSSVQTFGYVMTVPVPEPVTLITLGAGALLVCRRKRKSS